MCAGGKPRGVAVALCLAEAKINAGSEGGKHDTPSGEKHCREIAQAIYKLLEQIFRHVCIVYDGKNTYLITYQ
jgi:hypothetical protein